MVLIPYVKKVSVVGANLLRIVKVNLRPIIVFKFMQKNVTFEKFLTWNSSDNELNHIGSEQITEDVGVLVFYDVVNNRYASCKLILIQSNIYSGDIINLSIILDVLKVVKQWILLTKVMLILIIKQYFDRS